MLTYFIKYFVLERTTGDLKFVSVGASAANGEGSGDMPVRITPLSREMVANPIRAEGYWHLACHSGGMWFLNKKY